MRQRVAPFACDCGYARWTSGSALEASTSAPSLEELTSVKSIRSCACHSEPSGRRFGAPSGVVCGGTLTTDVGESTSASASVSATFVRDASGSWTSGLCSYNTWPVVRSRTYAACACSAKVANWSTGAAAGTVSCATGGINAGGRFSIGVSVVLCATLYESSGASVFGGVGSILLLAERFGRGGLESRKLTHD